MADNTVDVDATAKLLGSPEEAATGDRARLWSTALRLLASGEPVILERLAAAADVSVTDLADSPAGQDIEYDEQRRIIGWGLNLNPTPHRFTVNDHQLLTWCAP